MICLNLETRDPFLNLAIEEIFLLNRPGEYLILYINDPSVIIGKHQSAHREVNTRFLKEHNIPLVRRITGGGTVFHDHGNLNFTFIRNSEEGKQVDFSRHMQPVIGFLRSEGISAVAGEKNDILVDGLKISGNAEHVFRKKVLHHGTLLFSTSLDMLRNSIRTDKSRYSTRAVNSNPSHVTNLKDHLGKFSDISAFSQALMDYLMAFFGEIKAARPTDNDISEALDLAETKYRKWEWNYGWGPEYSFSNSFMYKNTVHNCVLHVRDGIITGCEMEGGTEMKRFAAGIIGKRHLYNDFRDVLIRENINFSEEEIFNFF